MSAPLPGLAVESATGIDVTLPLAGTGARSFAFVVDWHIRVTLALAWYGAAALLYNYSRGGSVSLAPPLSDQPRWFGAVWVPAVVLYFLYHPALELFMRGSTPGKRMAGVRVVARDGSAPSAGALLVRNVFRLVDSLPVFYALGLTLTALTREHVRCGDMAAGTLLVYETASPGFALAPAATAGRLDLATAELVAELLARWSALTAPSRNALARQLLVRCGQLADGVAPLNDAALHRELLALSRASEAAP